MRFTADLDVTDRHVVVVGGTPAALAKISELQQAAARVTVVAPEVVNSIRDLALRSLINWLPRGLQEADLVDAALMIAGAGDPSIDNHTLEAASRHGIAAFLVQSEVIEEGSRGKGEVILVGGGPGDPGLLTVAGLEAIQTADVIVCDRLAPLAALREAKPDAEIIDVGKIPRDAFTPQEEINRLLIAHALRGCKVVRFKGGDSFVFGRGGEEWQACAEAGVEVRVIPGVTSATAAPALAAIPVTHRQLTQGFSVVSGHLPPGNPGSTLDWAALARTNTTLLIMMGIANLAAIASELITDGMDPATPAATIADAGLPSMRTLRSTVGEIAAATAAAQMKAPAVVVIGAVAAFDPLA